MKNTDKIKIDAVFDKMCMAFFSVNYPPTLIPELTFTMTADEMHKQLEFYRKVLTE